MPDKPKKSTEQLVAEQAQAWSAVVPPNDAAIAFAAGLTSVIEGFARLQGQMAFEEEPSSFEAALQATKERAP